MPGVGEAGGGLAILWRVRMVPAVAARPRGTATTIPPTAASVVVGEDDGGFAVGAVEDDLAADELGLGAALDGGFQVGIGGPEVAAVYLVVNGGEAADIAKAPSTA